MYKHLIAFLLVGAVSTLATCTPSHRSHNSVEWRITNHTTDTLSLSVGYPLDSVVVPPSNVPRMRHALTMDSLLQDYDGQRYPYRPLERIAWHRGRWYWVRSDLAPLGPNWRDAAGNVHAAAVNRKAGILTYKLVPGAGHEVAGVFCLPCDTLPPAFPPLVSLRLRQGRAQRFLPLGKELNQLFQAQPRPWREWLDWGPTTYRYELRVGPGLTLNDE